MSVKISTQSSVYSVLFPKINVLSLLDVEGLASTFCECARYQDGRFDGLHMEALVLPCTILYLNIMEMALHLSFLVRTSRLTICRWVR